MDSYCSSIAAETGVVDRSNTSGGSRQVTDIVRQRIERAGERLWRLERFRDLPSTAVGQALRLLSDDVLQFPVLLLPRPQYDGLLLRQHVANTPVLTSTSTYLML